MNTTESTESMQPVHTMVDDWSFTIDGAFTHIYDEDGNVVTTFYRHLTSAEVSSFKKGFELGLKLGKEVGRSHKCSEIRRVLEL